jgi:hypothetical protein
MNKGDIAQEAPRASLQQPRDVFVAGFMGEASRAGNAWRSMSAWASCVGLTQPLHRDCPRRGRGRDPPRNIRDSSRWGAGLLGTVAKAAYLGGLMEYTIATVLGNLFGRYRCRATARRRRRGDPAVCDHGGADGARHFAAPRPTREGQRAMYVVNRP